MRLFHLLVCLLASAALSAQDWSARPWPAHWVTHPTAPATEFAVLNFRRTFTLTEIPDSLPVLVSADNRYQLFVNGRRVGEGPARGDLQHWRYETYDLKDYVNQGENVIATAVWNYGIDRPWSQQSYRTAFVLQPAGEEFAELKTDEKWKVYHNGAYSPITDARERLGTYIVAGPQLRIDGNRMPWGWETPDFEDGDWPLVKTVTRAMPRGVGTEYYWGLTPRAIPKLARRPLPHRVSGTWRETGVAFNFSGTYTVQAGTTQRLLLDLGAVSNFYPRFGVYGSADAQVKITYAESLFHPDGTKGHRDRIRGKEMRGVFDLVVPVEEAFTTRTGQEFVYETPWFRTGRYVEIELRAGATENLTLAGVGFEEFAYPFTIQGNFSTSDRSLRTKEIWDVAWQTARMCAQETYVDCPYYEQLQYVGDTRIQALISLYVSGDDRLMRKAINLFDQSRTSEGLTQSRYPSSVPQVIPPYSLSWIEMVGDYWMHRPDTAFVKRMLSGVRSVLDWYDEQLLDNGLVGPTKHWNFVDWTDDWPWDNALRVGGVPDMTGGSSIISLQLLSALQRAEKMSRYFGNDHRAAIYKDRADRVAAAVLEHCWKPDRGLFSDTPAGTSFSQHANILALLTDLAPATAPKSRRNFKDQEHEANHDLLMTVLNDQTLTQVSEYFRFYLVQAMEHIGDGYLYPDQLGVWAAHLDNGFTTFPERPGETRSDCHAWSASPNYDLLATVAGIRPAEPGFRSVVIRPASVGFDYTAQAAHPAGVVSVKRQSSRSGRDLFYTIKLPPGVFGKLETEGQAFMLEPGKNKVTVGLE